MGRDGALRRGRALWILAAGSIGYLIGGWHAAAVRTSDLSPSQTIALRFPQDQDVAAADDVATGMTGAVNTMVLGDPRLALLDPAPMVPQARPQAANQAAAPEEVAAAAPAANVSLRRAVPATVQAAITPKSSVALPIAASSNRGRASCSTTRRSRASRSACT